MNINPKVGEEWAHSEWRNFSYIITFINHEIYLNKYSLITNDINIDSWDHYDNITKNFLFITNWTYVGTPVVCDNCEHYCNQNIEFCQKMKNI